MTAIVDASLERPGNITETKEYAFNSFKISAEESVFGTLLLMMA